MRIKKHVHPVIINEIGCTCNLCIRISVTTPQNFSRISRWRNFHVNGQHTPLFYSSTYKTSKHDTVSKALTEHDVHLSVASWRPRNLRFMCIQTYIHIYKESTPWNVQVQRIPPSQTHTQTLNIMEIYSHDYF